MGPLSQHENFRLQARGCLFHTSTPLTGEELEAKDCSADCVRLSRGRIDINWSACQGQGRRPAPKSCGRCGPLRWATVWECEGGLCSNPLRQRAGIAPACGRRAVFDAFGIDGVFGCSALRWFLGDTCRRLSARNWPALHAGDRQRQGGGSAVHALHTYEFDGASHHDLLSGPVRRPVQPIQPYSFVRRPS